MASSVPGWSSGGMAHTGEELGFTGGEPRDKLTGDHKVLPEVTGARPAGRAARDASVVDWTWACAPGPYHGRQFVGEVTSMPLS